MKLTPQLKSQIDSLSYESLLRKWRFAPLGHPLFQGESGKYFAQRMSQLRNQPGGQSRHVAASKEIGWQPN